MYRRKTLFSTGGFMFADRLQKLSASLPAAGLDAVALNPGTNLAYLTGLHFHLMERPVVFLLAPGAEPVIVLPDLEKAKVEQLPFPARAITYGENPATWGSAFEQAARSLGLAGRRIGMDPRQMRLLELWHVQAAAPGMQILDGSAVLSSLRLRKDTAEVDAMRRAPDRAGRLAVHHPLGEVGHDGARLGW
jgi:Xaa-Pro dipeptidase